MVATACAPPATPPASTAQGQASIKALARDALARRDRMMPEPYPCGSGWTETPAGYVVAVSAWAEQAGLRPGDRIVSVGGAQVAGDEERAQAYRRVPTGGPFVVGVIRKRQPTAVSLPCRYQPDLFGAERRTLDAASRGEWDECLVAAREARRLAGFTAYANVIWEQSCLRAKNPSMTSPEGAEFAARSFEAAQLLLRDSRFVPGGTTDAQGTVRQIADDLKRSGFPAYANDLETQLQGVLATLPRLQLTWADNSTNEESFVVERKTGQAGTYQHLATLPPNTTTYVDMAVEEGVTYCYRVKAFNASGDSGYTNEACAMPSPSTSSGGGGGGLGGDDRGERPASTGAR
jgi:hypothetical protein